MIFNPCILALFISSLCITIMIVYAACHGLKILFKWDIRSGSEYQLTLERQTYLISSVVTCFMVFQLFSLFLFIYTSNEIHTFFVGAMCAVGSLSADSYGYPTLLVKILTFIFSGIWLFINYTDNNGYDYPLIRIKYLLLELIAPLLITENILQWLYFSGLHPDIITSCCGSLFSSGGRSIAGDIAGMPVVPSLVLFFVTITAIIVIGLINIHTGKLAYLFGILAAVTGIVSVVVIISAVSIYIYELPAHHCPFCILESRYNYIGYLLYFTILCGTITGIGTAVLHRFRKIKSLIEVIPGLIRMCTIISMTAFFILGLIATTTILNSHLQIM